MAHVVSRVQDIRGGSYRPKCAAQVSRGLPGAPAYRRGPVAGRIAERPRITLSNALESEAVYLALTDRWLSRPSLLEMRKFSFRAQASLASGGQSEFCRRLIEEGQHQ
jgi:hypothetical protein